MKSILIISAILFLSLTSANLILSENTIDITTKVNQELNYSLTIQNNHSFNIMDVEFATLEDFGFTFPENIEINSGDTQTIDFTIKPTQSYHEQIASKIQFKFEVDLPEEITNYNIYVSNTGFDLQYLTIREGDTITWTNEDTIIHTIESTEFGQLSIAPNSTATHTFSNQGTINFHDADFEGFSFFNGVVDVVARTSTQKVHNPIYDKILIVNLDSILEDTNLSISNSKNNYEVENKKSKKGQLTIENIGNEIAEIIKITSEIDWIYFDDNNLNIPLNDQEWVEYTVMPYFLDSNKTDKNYTIEIKIKATNSIEYTETITVYVPYQEITEDFSSDYEYAVYMNEVFCVKRPCSQFCSPELPECQANYTDSMYGGGTCNLNASENFLYNLLREISELKSASERGTNSQIAFQDEYGNKIDSSLSMSNESLSKQEDLEKKERNTTASLWAMGIIIFIILIAYWIIMIFNKKAQKESILEGDYQHKSE